MGLFGFGKKTKKNQKDSFGQENSFWDKEEQPKISSALPLESETRHIDDLDLPPFPSEQQVDINKAEEYEKSLEKDVPDELPPIEDVPSYEDDVPLPESAESSETAEFPETNEQEKLFSDIVQKKTDLQKDFFQEPQEQKQQTFRGDQQEKNISYPNVQESSQERTQLNTQGPIFIKIENYKKVLSEISTIKSKLNESLKTINRINEIKNPEDSEFNRWKEKLEDIQRKILYVDKTIFEKSQL